jgi:5-methylcytosine-specific restriction endonuclease McrA
MSGPPDLAPKCPRCRRHHLSTLPCWGGRYSQQLRRLAFETWGDECWLCGHPGATTVDHVKSRARGGTDALANLRPAHRFCNTGRGAGDPRPPTTSPVTVEINERWAAQEVLDAKMFRDDSESF